MIDRTWSKLGVRGSRIERSQANSCSDGPTDAIGPRQHISSTDWQRRTSTTVPTTMNITYCRSWPVCIARSDRPRSQVLSANVSTQPSIDELVADDRDHRPPACDTTTRQAVDEAVDQACGRALGNEAARSNSVGRTNIESYSSSNHHLCHEEVVERANCRRSVVGTRSARHRYNDRGQQDAGQRRADRRPVRPALESPHAWLTCSSGTIRSRQQHAARVASVPTGRACSSRFARSNSQPPCNVGTSSRRRRQTPPAPPAARSSPRGDSWA